MTVEVVQAAEAASWCAFDALADAFGGLDCIERASSMLGSVACRERFDQRAVVVDGASRPSAIGVAALPLGDVVEIEVGVSVRDAAR